MIFLSLSTKSTTSRKKSHADFSANFCLFSLLSISWAFVISPFWRVISGLLLCLGFFIKSSFLDIPSLSSPSLSSSSSSLLLLLAFCHPFVSSSLISLFRPPLIFFLSFSYRSPFSLFCLLLSILIRAFFSSALIRRLNSFSATFPDQQHSQILFSF